MRSSYLLTITTFKFFSYKSLTRLKSDKTDYQLITGSRYQRSHQCKENENYEYDYLGLLIESSEGGREGLRWCDFVRFLVRFCGDFNFKSRYCGFTEPSGLRYFEIFGYFQCALRFFLCYSPRFCGIRTPPPPPPPPLYALLLPLFIDSVG